MTDERLKPVLAVAITNTLLTHIRYHRTLRWSLATPLVSPTACSSLSDNELTNEGARQLCRAIQTSRLKKQLRKLKYGHSVNMPPSKLPLNSSHSHFPISIAYNCIDDAGMVVVANFLKRNKGLVFFS